MIRVSRILFSLSAFLIPAILAGCAGSVTSATGSTQTESCSITTSGTVTSCPVRTPVAGVAFTGKVTAGAQPVAGAAVQLYAAGNSGNGSSPTPLLTAPVSTAVNGSFAVAAGYACPSAATPVYLLSKGGQPGTGATANAGLWLMAALGPCGSIASGGGFVLNELTTVASVWALAPFGSAGGNIGASCTNTIGLTNAFLTAGNLVNMTTGSTPGIAIPSTLAVPAAKLDTLANLLASCTTSSNGSACSSFFNAAPSGSVVPSNTVDALLNIAHSPGSNVSTLFSLASTNVLYSPTLHAAPPDWMLANTITGGGMASPASVSIAASGNVWVSSYFNTVSQFLPTGATAYPSGIGGYGINQSYGIALDPQGNLWIANEQTNPNNGTGNVTELNGSGQALATGLTGGGINYPIAVAADTNGDMWFANYGTSTVTLLNGSGVAVSGSAGWGAKALTYPVALAVDAGHNAWIASQGGTLPITRISADGSKVDAFSCDCNGASGVAVDQNNNVWIANYYGNSISEVNSCGTLMLDAATGGGLQHPQAIAVDGSGAVWVANYLGNSITEVAGASSAKSGTFLSPPAGFGGDATLMHPYGLAIDASGAVWVSNFGNSTLTQFVGVAVPVKTPLAGPPQAP